MSGDLQAIGNPIKWIESVFKSITIEASLQFRVRYKYVEQVAMSLRPMLCKKEARPEAIENKAIKESNEDSPMVQSCYQTLSGEKQELRIKITAIPRSTMLLLCLEGQKFAILSEGTCLNRKGEWGQNFPPKFPIEDPDEKKISGLDLRRGERRNIIPKPPLKEAKTFCFDLKRTFGKENKMAAGSGRLSY